MERGSERWGKGLTKTAGRRKKSTSSEKKKKKEREEVTASTSLRKKNVLKREPLKALR